MPSTVSHRPAPWLKDPANFSSCAYIGNVRKRAITPHRLKKEAKQRAARELQRTKRRLGLGELQPLKGIVPHPLAATTLPRQVKTAPLSNRIPGTAAARDLLHAHKWKQGLKETEATTREIRRKSTQIAPAYNKGALQYLPGGTEKDEWPER
jgi:hypothetical protein